MLERYLMIFIFTSLLAMGILTYIVIRISQTTHSSQSSDKYNHHADICLRADCVQAASQILEKIDVNVEPCIDFYEFACGNFMKTTNIPDDKFSVNMFSEIEDSLANQLNALLSSEAKDDDIKPVLLAKFLHSSCMDVKTIEATGRATIQRILKQLGGWPVLHEGKWNSTWTWDKLGLVSSRMGYSSHYLLSFTIASDWKNSSRRILDVREINLLFLTLIQLLNFIKS